MARIRKEMSKYFTVLFILFQTVCQICHTLETVESYNQAFIQTDKHLTYIIGDVLSGIPIEFVSLTYLKVKPGQIYNDIQRDEILLPNAIHLDPAMLDFHEQPVGMPRMEQVTVLNTDGKNNLHLLSISGSTAHFHCSFFQDKIVPPGGNTTFDVVFLARQEGNVENTLYIHTSLGSFKYQVFGVGTSNPYRLRPYLGARVPVNRSFAPLINMHNPHSTTLQVLEIFSSEGDLHLELPTGEKEAPKSLWEIPPYETKTIMKANFVGRTENNHTAFIRIKTNSRLDRQLLVLPMEVEVTSSPGIYLSSELIDFGIVRTFDEPKTVPVNLINTGDSVVHISSVTVHPPNEAITVDFRPIKLHPELLRQTTVAHVTFRASKAIQPKYWSGKIIIRSKNNVHKISIPYEAKVLHGSLTYHKNSTYFFAHNRPANLSRAMTFTNTFNFSLVLYNVTLPSELKNIFTILNFSKPVILPPQRQITPFLLKFHPNADSIHFTTTLQLHTNASVFDIELVIYNGQIKIIPHTPQKLEGQLDFGTLGVKENKSVLFTIVNDNPIELYLYEFSTDMKGATVQVLGIEKGNGTLLTREHNMSAINTDPTRITYVLIPAYHFAVLSLNLVAPEEEGQYQAEVILSTMYQDTFIPVTVRTSEGSLHAIPERVVFDKVFPGKIPMKVLQVHSTFHEYMGLKSVMFQPPDPRFYFVSSKENMQNINSEQLLVLEPQTNNTIGKIYYDSKLECKEECYVGLATHTPAGRRWAKGLELDIETPETDEYLYRHMRERWQAIQEQGKDRVNVTIEIDTSTVQGFLFSAHVQHHWPDVIRKCFSRFKFPLTQIGNMSTLDIMIENPGDTPIVIQVVPLHLYPSPQVIVDLIRNNLPPHFSEYVETDDPDIFTLPELSALNARADSQYNKFRKHVDDTLSVQSHRGTLSTFLAKNAKVKVQVGFRPKDDNIKTSLIIVRNNLTIIDAIVLEGQGGRGELKLNNKRPGLASLQFDIAEKHLKHCDRKKFSKNTIPNFTVKRSFTLLNTGELPFYVHGYSINNSPCEGYGFRILMCEGYEMKPNTSRKIDIAFTPDFTMSRIQRTLTIFTSLGQAFNFTLQATVPPHTLAKCAMSLPRPNWEHVLYYSIVCFMGFLLFCILVASYFEADRIFIADILKRKVKMCVNGIPTFQKDKIFDLKALASNSHTNGVVITQAPAQKMSLPVNLLNKVPHANMDIPNGHTEIKSPQDSLWTMTLSILKGLFSRKPALKKKTLNNNTDKHPDSQKSADTLLSSLQNSSTLLKEKSKVQEMIIPEKSSATHSVHHAPQKLTLRKVKQAKRSYAADSTSTADTQSAVHFNRKLNGKTNAAVKEKKVTDTVTPIEDTNTTTTVLDSSSSASIEDVRSVDNKKRGKKKLQSKPEHDTLGKELFTAQLVDDKDESSSTTTESSSGDVEDKTSAPRNDSPETIPQPPKTRRKNRTRNLEPLIIPPPDDDSEEFELTSKSRAYKKIKGQYGGEIPASGSASLDIDLPYNIEKTMKKKLPRPIKEVGKTTTTKGKGNYHDLDMLDEIYLDTHLSESDSPAPSWDEPNLASPADDFAELSIQTDQFAQHQTKSADLITRPANISPDGLTSSSRSSSYSSIVSSSSAESKAKGDKRFGSVSETGLVVPMTTKTPPLVTSKRSAWGTGSSTTPSTPEILGSGLSTIQENSRAGNTLTDTQAGALTTSTSAFSFGLNVPSTSSKQGFAFSTLTNSGGGDAYLPSQGLSQGLDPLGGQQDLTMMQKLQQDRRRRLMEYQNRLRPGEDWPGFDTPLMRNTHESLWDSEYSTEYNPMETNNSWPTGAGLAATTSQTGIWSTLTNSANSSWNSLMGIWGGSGTPAVSSITNYSGYTAPSSTATSQEPATDGLFDPFNSPIWSPSAGLSSSGWSNSSNMPSPSGHNNPMGNGL
ncbi:LOW QUALITY PROTEIN: transmembrane protein 131-like [Dreissena polymorpha]|uniref:LOW QUALITY PROTEIN: transmembrane protein 131-like n=1 Tax=Dreissena polymorpha TaxID=45954 RepID=UPI0022644245|nr:LOW QUALITY PROTEIN: transmembrane protein 131-like [Dreissena polymorpha]